MPPRAKEAPGPGSQGGGRRPQGDVVTRVTAAGPLRSPGDESGGEDARARGISDDPIEADGAKRQ